MIPDQWDNVSTLNIAGEPTAPWLLRRIAGDIVMVIERRGERWYLSCDSVGLCRHPLGHKDVFYAAADAERIVKGLAFGHASSAFKMYRWWGLLADDVTLDVFLITVYEHRRKLATLAIILLLLTAWQIVQAFS